MNNIAVHIAILREKKIEFGLEGRRISQHNLLAGKNSRTETAIWRLKSLASQLQLGLGEGIKKRISWIKVIFQFISFPKMWIKGLKSL